ncbi:MAG: thioesterase [Sphaerochaetaceae bacterium]|nr:thioesterase [Sphaerochaetaceae bacterium]
MFRINDGNVYESDFTTYTYNTDAHYHARLEFYFQMLQEVAGHHAALRGCSIPELNAEGKTWVVTRTRMKIHRYTVWPERLLLETWAQPGYKLHFPRATRIKDEAGAPILEAMAWWAVLDIQHNFRPCRPQEITGRIGSPALEDATHYCDPALGRRVSYEEAHAQDICSCKPQIKYLDTDYNQHVNNISYIGWMLDSLPVPFRDEYKVAEIDVSWIHQTFRNDALTVYTGAVNTNEMEKGTPQFYHKIVRTEPDGGETVVWEATTVWKSREAMFTGV